MEKSFFNHLSIHHFTKPDNARSVIPHNPFIWSPIVSLSWHMSLYLYTNEIKWLSTEVRDKTKARLRRKMNYTLNTNWHPKRLSAPLTMWIATTLMTLRIIYDMNCHNRQTQQLILLNCYNNILLHNFSIHIINVCYIM